MINAFGVEHGEVSKAMNPTKLGALRRVSLGLDQKADYASAKLALHESPYRHNTMGKENARMTMRDMSRTRFGVRQANKNKALTPSPKVY